MLGEEQSLPAQARLQAQQQHQVPGPALSLC